METRKHVCEKAIWSADPTAFCIAPPLDHNGIPRLSLKTSVKGPFNLEEKH